MLGVSLGYQKITLREFPDPQPGPGEVLIGVKVSLICRSDLSLYHGNSVFTEGARGPIVAGHEPSGVVEDVGPGVRALHPGDRVAVHAVIGCAHCGPCRAGFYQHCAESRWLGFHVHGSDADFLVVPERNCLRIPDDLSYIGGALSTDTIGTLFHTQKRLGVSGTDMVAIFGIGPMGAAGVLVAKARGAKVCAVDLSDSRLQWARELGADEVVNPGLTDPVAALLDLTGGRGPEVAIDCSGSAVAQNQAVDAVAVHGRVGIVGGCSRVTFNPREQFIRKQLTMIGNWYFSVGLFDEILGFILRNKIPLERLITHRYPLVAAEEAFTAFDQGRTGKVAFVLE